MLNYIGKYEVVRHLGSGQYGDVWSVIDRVINVKKAIKVLKSDKREDLNVHIKEARILYECRHKNIVTLNEANIIEIDGKERVVLDMELIEGNSIEKHMGDNNISVIESLKYVADILYGLEYVHKKGLLHRDIKPANILIDNKTAKLSDFGLATILGIDYLASCKAYISHAAPECFLKQHTSIKTDIYAMGLTLFRLVNNIDNWRPTYHGLDDPIDLICKGKLISRIGNQAHIPISVKKIINKSCNIDSKKRYESAKKMRQAIEKLKPSIHWYKESDTVFIGVSYDNKKDFEVFVNKKNKFVYKINGRKQNNYNKEFGNKIDAIKYLNKFVADTMFE